MPLPGGCRRARAGRRARVPWPRTRRPLARARWLPERPPASDAPWSRTTRSIWSPARVPSSAWSSSGRRASLPAAFSTTAGSLACPSLGPDRPARYAWPGDRSREPLRPAGDRRRPAAGRSWRHCPPRGRPGGQQPTRWRGSQQRPGGDRVGTPRVEPGGVVLRLDRRRHPVVQASAPSKPDPGPLTGGIRRWITRQSAVELGRGGQASRGGSVELSLRRCRMLKKIVEFLTLKWLWDRR